MYVPICLLAGLNAEELGSLEAPVFPYLSKDSIHRIPVKVFSVSHFSASNCFSSFLDYCTHSPFLSFPPWAFFTIAAPSWTEMLELGSGQSDPLTNLFLLRKALSLTQLRSLGAENLLMVTPAQRGALTTEQRAALDETLSGFSAEGSDHQPLAADPPQSGREITYKRPPG